ncbi:MAG: TatD family hydrolase [Planctomycetaceae bacterium]|nr:TatD family hydrolase [Planctomycetaceae bacterium]
MTNNVLPIFDTHAHLNLLLDEIGGAPESKKQKLIKRLETGRFPKDFVLPELNGRSIQMTGVVLPGTNAASSCRCIELAAESQLFHAAVGIHPNGFEHLNDAEWKEIETLAERSDAAAIGETGLDLYHDKTPLSVQIEYLERHFALSAKTGKAVIVHCRDAWESMQPLLEKWAQHLPKVVIHAFSDSPEYAKFCVQKGFYVSFAGSLTYRNVKFAPLWESCKVVPLEQLLVETDSPFLVPHPFRGRLECNEPTLSAAVVFRLAELRCEDAEVISERTSQNAKRLFVR